MNNVKIQEVITQIEKQSDYKFFLKTEEIDALKNVTIKIESSKIDVILTELFKDSPIKFEIKGKEILLINKKSNVLKEQKSKINVEGLVLDKSNQPLPGVSVLLKGTSDGCVTDFNGKFNLSVSKGDFIKVSFLGFSTQEIKVENQTNLQIILNEDSKNLDEVVVVGYGTMKKRDVTGAVASVKAGDVTKSSPTSITQGLQGKLAGVQISQSDGAPGGGVNIQIRGANSLNGSSEPLYVVDGIPFSTAGTPTGSLNSNQKRNPLASLNPKDIESIEVLKDASSCAIYGSRASNGVVLITTKKGKEGTDNIEFNTSFSVSRIAKQIKMLNSYDYARKMNEIKTNGYYYNGGDDLEFDFPLVGYYSKNDTKTDSSYVNGISDYKSGKGPNTNWQDEIFRTAITKDYSISYSGGNEKGSYNVSAGYLDQEGIIVNSGYQRYNLNLNIDRKLMKIIEVGTFTNFTNSINKLAKTSGSNSTDDAGIIFNALIFPSTRPVYDISSGVKKFSAMDYYGSNPYVYVRDAKDELNSIDFTNSTYLQVNIFDFLSFRQNIGYNYSISEREAYYPRTTMVGKSPVNGSAIKVNSWYKSMTFESLINFNKEFYKIHSINAVVGWTFEKNTGGYQEIDASNFANDILKDNSIGGGIDRSIVASSKSSSALMSYLGRLNYSLMNRYLFTVSFRRDGSSVFITGNKWSFFPSYALAWRLSEESFVKALGIFDNLKLRGSYGETGNQSIGSNVTSPSLVAANTALNGSIIHGLSEDQWVGLTNSNLKWERTKQYDAAIEIGVLNGRVNLTIDGYSKKTTDMLQQVQLAPSCGYTIKQANSGWVENKGLEFTLNALVLQAPFKWIFDANISFNRNKIGGLVGDQFANAVSPYITSAFIQRNRQPIGVIYGYKTDGCYDNEAEVKADPAYAGADAKKIKSMIGEYKYKNMDSDPTITPNDRTIIGNTNPDYTFGITNSFEYKNFSLSFFFQASIGNDIINTFYLDMKREDSYNIPESVYNNRWQAQDVENGDLYLKKGTNSSWRKLSTSYERSDNSYLTDKEVEDGSYVKLKNINFGYTFFEPIKLIKTLNLYGSISNVYTWTKYSWYDPDVNAFGDDSSRRGVDMNSYPTSRTFTIGIKCVF